MAKLLINYAPFEIRVGLVENGQLVEFYVERPSEKSLVGNIYKGKVVRVVPGINSAFLDLGLSRTAFLFGDDIMPSSEIEWEKDTVFMANLYEILKEGQEILVQVIKEPLGNKGARVSTNLTLPGHYLVYLPYMNRVGISRKIKDDLERKRLREIVERIKPPNTGWIIRTAAVGATEEELKAELDFLLCLWGEIKEKAEKMKAPALVYEELNIALRAIRDLFTKDISEIVVDDKDFFEEIKNFLERYFPNLAPYIKLYQGKEDIFFAHGIQIDIKKLLSRKVWLKSGGFIVIEPCEAFTAIDVNTGRYTGTKELEETVYKINLEAAEEIAYQLRLRNIGGLIIIDFIDMENPEHQELVVQTLKEALKKDKAKNSFLPISAFGILQMTRERKRDSLYKIFLESCPYCHGEGSIKSKKTIYYEILRRLIKMGPHIKNKKIEIEIHPDLSEIIGEEIHYLEDLEKKYGFSTTLKPNKEFLVYEYKFHILT
ncbi:MULTISPECIES: Rne/Rng family ribonuclease [Thermodesulfobacterium]|jgi:ribonuclease G|uniref:Ribonuclease G n=2 Tax=Thermodesulfobacterium commune TaxID=1741 RepID=A0A075WS37_9BACT|nr:MULTISPECIES: Rne/Rng family ribonuclease [Thermodesulfobacterium]KUJ97622.1 MAG: Ribonuclease, Rne/Rng family [Thermodesulfobacterium sp. 37_54]KUK18832.1 MAG: Ribonuclease, Rne/Rng family [Thermodesulfobacterium commune]AIH04074.1 ribonuclease [Thermodesulfobacterium commune DSM 2178]KUK37417.1 MAG: Ribonuclease, Rne/Rng family [Thermodesulfobacterium commune]MBZ4681455.1 ribonuclease [Thermodesulfobacterium sp.]